MIFAQLYLCYPCVPQCVRVCPDEVFELHPGNRPKGTPNQHRGPKCNSLLFQNLIHMGSKHKLSHSMQSNFKLYAKSFSQIAGILEFLIFRSDFLMFHFHLQTSNIVEFIELAIFAPLYLCDPLCATLCKSVSR